MNKKQKEIIAIVAVVIAGAVALTLSLMWANNANNEKFITTLSGTVPLSTIKKVCSEEYPNLSEDTCISLAIEGLNK